ncbi:MAG: hypothetical protein IJY06_10695 [Oscillospiraceae bacterium]|nr:hypothetical protein [Oscillospiraceae bacterium]MBQ8010507.1 hypothetical protein [Oscillospiraceae bacterium]MBQ9111811.1 hypothetical protein [Oscillospiraceae bacterium]
MDNKTIHIEEIMQNIRKEIKEKGLSSDMLSFEDVPYQKPDAAVNGAGSEEVKNSLVYLNGHYNVQPYKPLGGNPLFVFIKKVLRKLMKFYIEPIVNDQNNFNANVVRVLNAQQNTPAPDTDELMKRLEVLELNQKQLTLRVAALQQENAALRSRIGKQG